MENILISGNPTATDMLFQAVDERSLASIGEEAEFLSSLTDREFCLTAVVVDDWFCDLSPWKAPAAFGNNSFGDGADRTLLYIKGLCTDTCKRYYLAGYSLSGLFALWAAYQTDIFKGVAGASPSMWFPGFNTYMKEHDIRCDSVYLSLGDREKKTKNKIMATVDDCIRNAYDLLKSNGTDCFFEYNRGNHFTDVDKRCARAFAWLLNGSC